MFASVRFGSDGNGPKSGPENPASAAVGANLQAGRAIASSTACKRNFTRGSRGAEGNVCSGGAAARDGVIGLRVTVPPWVLAIEITPRYKSRAPAPDGQAPSELQTSSLAAIRSRTAVVNSVVPAWPPRSGVLIPEATVSSAPS